MPPRSAASRAAARPGARRYADGMACTWGLDDAELDRAALPHTVILRETTPITALADGTLPMAWTGTS
jgi:hypothetical protein